MDRVTTIIVNYRLKYFIEQTLLSLRETYTQVPGHTIVIDNASGDGSVEFLSQRFPDVKFICNEENVGFAKANNQGIKLADTDYILVLNPDTIIGDDTLRDVVEWMDSHPESAATGVKMVDGNGHFLPESKRSFPSVWNSFCKLFGLSSLFPRSKVFARYHLHYLDKDQPHIIPVLAGAFMLLRTSVVKKVGGFDEDFFMYGEDMDLSFRMATDGMVNYYVPTPIIHYKGECTKTDSLDYVKTFYEAMYIFYRKHYPKSSVACRMFIKIAIKLRMGISALKSVAVSSALKNMHHSKRSILTCVISKNAQDIINVLDNEGFDPNNCRALSSLDELPLDQNNVNIILDDRELNYGEIISSIIAHSAPNHFFHIYSGRNNIIISPKSHR